MASDGILRIALVVLTFAAPTLAACGKNSASATGASGEGNSSSGGDASSEGGSIVKAELTSCVDTDLTDGFAGPGWNSMTNAPSGTPQASYLAATTMGLQGDAAMQMSFNDLAGPVEAELQTQPGLIGYQLGISQKCRYFRTLTLWKDQASLTAFVMSAPHATAMSKVATVTHAAAFATWTIDASAVPPTWAMARQQIADNGLFEGY